jgi:ESF2/ABP1 family protein
MVVPGVCYISRIPPHMQVMKLRELLSCYGIERVYLKPKTDGPQQQHRRCYTEGWVEFTDKRVAKMAALSLHGSAMDSKKKSHFKDDLW